MAPVPLSSFVLVLSVLGASFWAWDRLEYRTRARICDWLFAILFVVFCSGVVSALLGGSFPFTNGGPTPYYGY